MKNKIVISLFLAAVLIPTAQYASGAGRSMTSVPNTILSGLSAPTSFIGINGDFYIDMKNAAIYGPKLKGQWPIPTSLRGPQGLNGTNGKTISNATSLTGLTGETGAKGATGETGAKGIAGINGINGSNGSIGATGNTGSIGSIGSTGLTGATGNTGSIGSTGLTGATGASGNNGSIGSTGLTGATGNTGSIGATGAAGLTGSTGASGNNGTNGSTGSTGATGNTGSQGATGATGSIGSTGATGSAGSQGATGATGNTGSQGATGATGSAGISTTNFVNIQSFAISTSTPGTFSDSSSFGNLEQGNSYNFTIIIDGTFATSNPTNSFFLSAEVIGTSSVVQFKSLAIDAKSFTNGSEVRHYGFIIIGTVSASGSNPSLLCRIIDGSGASGGNAITFTGKAIVTLVGSIG